MLSNPCVITISLTHTFLVQFFCTTKDKLKNYPKNVNNKKIKKSNT